MIIKVFLIIGLFFCLFYAFLQRGKSGIVSWTISATSISGIFLVAFPDYSTTVAHHLGVGRGADLIMYCWIVISLAISVSLQFKILQLQEIATELARALAIQSAVRPSNLSTDNTTKTPSTE